MFRHWPGRSGLPVAASQRRGSASRIVGRQSSLEQPEWGSGDHVVRSPPLRRATPHAECILIDLRQTLTEASMKYAALTLCVSFLIFSSSTRDDGAARPDQGQDTISLRDYGASKAHPYGHANPAAPKELEQFHFMVGEFDRKERRRNRDGSWGPWTRGEWNARYFMNGHAIIDESINYKSKLATTNLRFYDPKDKAWKIAWFQQPGYSTTHAEGHKVGKEIVCTNKASKDRYVFHNITKDSYDWELRKQIGGQWVPVWQIVLTRKK